MTVNRNDPEVIVTIRESLHVLGTDLRFIAGERVTVTLQDNTTDGEWKYFATPYNDRWDGVNFLVHENDLAWAGVSLEQPTTDPEIHLCPQCNVDMGYEWLLGKVCGKCTRANHRKVTRR